MDINLRGRDHATIANTSAVISLIYSVLVGITALYLSTNNNLASDAVQREANSLANLYRDSKWLDDPAKSQIQATLKQYINKVIDVEWPQMEHDKDISKDGETLIENLDNQFRAYSKSTNTDRAILHAMIEDIKTLYNARQARIETSNATLSPESWIVILIGTILTIGMNILFKTRFHIHLITIGAVGLMTSSMIFLLITLERPFQGEFIIEPDAYKAILLTMGDNT